MAIGAEVVIGSGSSQGAQGRQDGSKLSALAANAERDVQKHTWRTRPDPFAKVWDEIEQRLRVDPGLQAKTLFEYLQERGPGRFGEGQLRTLQRRIKHRRALEGPPREFSSRKSTTQASCASRTSRIARRAERTSVRSHERGGGQPY